MMMGREDTPCQGQGIMKPIFDIRIQFPPSWLQMKEVGMFFVREIETHIGIGTPEQPTRLQSSW
jgi:hypothetical protein